jgi:hypothetical protein
MTRRFRRGAALAVGLGLGLVASPAHAQYAQPESPPPPQQQGPSNASDEAQDSGLGLEWVYLNADAGYSYVNMASFSASALGLEQTAGSGATWGVGAGVRLFFLSAGVRLRNTVLDNPGSLWQLDLEAAMHMRIWHIDPYFGVRGGYDWLGSFSTNAITTATGMSQPDVAVHGFDVGPMLGIDVYFSSLVSIGAEGAAQFLFLQRPPAPLPSNLVNLTPAQMQMALAMLPPSYQQLYQESGSSVGFGGTLTAHLGIHF